MPSAMFSATTTTRVTVLGPLLAVLAVLAMPSSAPALGGGPRYFIFDVRDRLTRKLVPGARVELFDAENRTVAEGTTDGEGFLRLEFGTTGPRPVGWVVTSPTCGFETGSTTRFNEETLSFARADLMLFFFVELDCKEPLATLFDPMETGEPLELGGEPALPCRDGTFSQSLDLDAPCTQAASVLVTDEGGQTGCRAVADGEIVNLGTGVCTEVGESVIDGGTICTPVLSPQGFAPTAVCLSSAEGGGVGDVEVETASSFLASSADGLQSPCRPDEPPELVYGWRERSIYAVYQAITGGGVNGLVDLVFERYLVPSSGILGVLDGGAQPSWATRASCEEPALVCSFATYFDELQSVAPTPTCSAPFTGEGTARIQCWADDERVFEEDLYELTGTFGPLCQPPIFTDSASTGDVAFFAANQDDELLLVAKDLADREKPADIVNLGEIPREDPVPSPPTLIGDADSGSVTLAVAGDVVESGGVAVGGGDGGSIFGWSEDAQRLGLAPWRLDILPIEVQGPRGYPFELTTSILGNKGYLAGRLTENQITAAGGDVSAGGDGGDIQLATVPLEGCLSTDEEVCLNDNRFALSTTYVLENGDRGAGHARPLSRDSATFWFFEKDNRELIVKVLDACGINGHYWLFAAGLTNVGVLLEATDLETSETKLYANPIGRAYEPVLDTQAWECGVEEMARAQERTTTAEPPVVVSRSRGRVIQNGPMRADRAPASSDAAAIAAAAGSTCGGGENALCLAGGRFRVEVAWRDFSGGSGEAFGDALTADTGALFFFDESNVEMLVKVLDACGVNDRYWLFAGALTNVGVDLVVTDTVTGISQTYVNELGSDFTAITDTGTFPCG